MATEISRIDRLTRTYDLATYIPGGLPTGITAVALALLPPRSNPTAATVWTTVTYATGTATVLLAGPDADSTGALVVPASADLWVKVDATPQVDAAKLERVTVLGGGAVLTAPTGVPVVSVNGKTGAAVVLSAADVGAQDEATLGADVAADATVRAAFVPATDLLNFTSDRLSKWQRAKARVRAGVADAKLLCIGDSTTGGVGSDGTSAQGKPTSYPAQLAALLNGSGLSAARGLAIPAPNVGNPDPRWTLGGSWNYFGNLAWGASSDLSISNGSTGTLGFADAVLADRFDVYYLTGSGLGTFTATATGGSGVTQATAGSQGIGKVTISAASAATTNTVSIVPAGVGDLHICGIEPWLSTAKRVRVGNAGVGGSQAVNWAGNGLGAGWNSQAAIKLYAPDLTIISLGINDANANATTAAFLAAIDTVVAAAQVSGDVVIAPPVPSRSFDAPANVLANSPLYAAALRGRSGLPYADLIHRWTSGDVADSRGYLWDALHPSGVGYADITQMVSPGLLAA